MQKLGFWLSIGDLIFSLLFHFFGQYVLALLPDMEVWCNTKIIISSIIASVAVCALVISILAIRKEKENIKKGLVIASVLVSFILIVNYTGLAIEMQALKPEFITDFEERIQNEETKQEDEEVDDGCVYGTGEYKNLFYYEEDMYYILECYNELEEIKDKLIKAVQKNKLKSIETIISELKHDELKIYVTKDMASIIKNENIQEKLIFDNSGIIFYDIDFEKLEQLISTYNIKTDLFTNEDKYNFMYYGILIDKEGNLYINPDEIMFDKTKYYTRFDEKIGFAYIQCIEEIETILGSLSEEQIKDVINYCKSNFQYTKGNIIDFIEEQDKINMITNEEVKNILYKEYNEGVVLFDLHKFVEYSQSKDEIPDFTLEKLNNIYNSNVLLENNKIYILPRNVVVSYYSWWE